jgi:hypothetical protein
MTKLATTEDTRDAEGQAPYVLSSVSSVVASESVL